MKTYLSKMSNLELVCRARCAYMTTTKQATYNEVDFIAWFAKHSVSSTVDKLESCFSNVVIHDEDTNSLHRTINMECVPEKLFIDYGLDKFKVDNIFLGDIPKQVPLENMETYIKECNSMEGTNKIIGLFSKTVTIGVFEPITIELKKDHVWIVNFCVE